MNQAGYSGTPLAKKLGIKEGYEILLINQPDYYFDLFSDMPQNISINNRNKSKKKNLIHYFAKQASDLFNNIANLKSIIESDGIIWISWPKKASNTPTDVTENLVREIGLTTGLVDIKVCAIDEIWSGLKFVIPLKDR